uniref:Uncharacterized protein n=1 Tax=Rhizophora mucronata TaxID=61149 RepID=A0A2P2PAW9_RHIMU
MDRFFKHNFPLKIVLPQPSTSSLPLFAINMPNF